MAILTLEQFIKKFPEFKELQQEVFDQYLEEFEIMYGFIKWGKLKPIAAGYYIAYMTVVFSEQYGEGDVTPPGSIQSEKIGESSITFATFNPAKNGIIYSEFIKNQYGRQFLICLRMVRRSYSLIRRH